MQSGHRHTVVRRAESKWQSVGWVHSAKCSRKNILDDTELFYDHTTRPTHFEPPRNRTRHLLPGVDPFSHYAISTRLVFLFRRHNWWGCPVAWCIAALPGVRITACGMGASPHAIQLRGRYWPLCVWGMGVDMDRLWWVPWL